MLSIYAVVSAILLLVLDKFIPIFKNENAWWLVPVIFVGAVLCFVVLQLLVFAISVFVVNPEKDNTKVSSFYRFITKITLPVLFKLAGVRIHITGEDKIPENTRVLLVSNHIHDFDPAIFLSSFPYLHLGFVGKKEIQTLMPFVAKMMSRLDCILIDRDNNREGIKAILKAVEYIKTDRSSIGIFPEGYTSKDGELKGFRNGAFKIATKAKAPIVACTLVNTDLITKNMFRRRTNVYLDVVDVITAEETAVMKTEEIAQRLHKPMEDNIAFRRKKDILALCQ